MTICEEEEEEQSEWRAPALALPSATSSPIVDSSHKTAVASYEAAVTNRAMETVA